ncbi:hypothetical protein [Paenibacillus sp. 1_12]|uniref:hypothetical protein n=1 Tax=Paenibacillus sp. 1_12 TaxID=1566278 RepID=UPI0011604A1A|nr:hypothetical protein [Paenibacillus sp. 1_12]
MIETNRIFTRIKSAAVSEQALPVNAVGNQQMKEQVRLAHSSKMPTPQLPVIANEISGRTYRVKKTGLDYSAFSLNFSNKSDVAVFKKILGVETVDISIGLDNEYRETGNYKAKGHWDGDAFISLSEEVRDMNGIFCCILCDYDSIPASSINP